MRLVSTINRSLGFKAKIYFNAEYSEYVARFYDDNGVHIKSADYFTDDKQDAINTAHLELNRQSELMQ